MEFQILPEVTMDEVPTPVTRGRKGQFEPVYDKVASLKRGKALPVSFQDEKKAVAARAALRKIAQRNEEVLSSSTEDRKTFFFWIEPKEA